jgi:hypothetical protein
MTGSAAPRGASERVRPLRPSDPPRLGDVSLSGRLEVTDAGIVYAGVLDDQPVVVALLSAGAEVDSYARARFHDAVRDARLTEGTSVLAGEDAPEIAPWVAVRADSWDDGVKLAGTLLAPVTLQHLDPVGDVRGPEFRPHWSRRGGPGRWRIWPLPWPAALSTAGRWTYVASFALVLAISAIALFIAVKIFDGQPPAPVNPPFPSPTFPTPTLPPTTPGPTTGTPPQSPSPPDGTGSGNPSIV